MFKQSVAPFDMEAEAKRHGVRTGNVLPVGSNSWDRTYNPYYGDGTERPVRVALPGEPGGRYYSNSTEHAASGFTNEDPKLRVAMVDRRLRRMKAIVEEAQRPVVVEGTTGPDATHILLSWGSSVEACREAAARANRHGKKVRVVGIRLLWPFPLAAVTQALAGKAPILCVEANALAQLARLVKSELPVHDRLRPLLQYDGRPITSDTILHRLENPS
jgi:2-oxoglutarate ferredoxin oxidoreductase subunit alpha